MGVDSGRESVALARAQGGPRYELCDAWDLARLSQLAMGVDVIFLDIGGVSSVDGLEEGLALVRALSATFSSTLRVLVVKSRCISDHARAIIRAENRPKTEAPIQSGE